MLGFAARCYAASREARHRRAQPAYAALRAVWRCKALRGDVVHGAAKQGSEQIRDDARLRYAVQGPALCCTAMRCLARNCVATRCAARLCNAWHCDQRFCSPMHGTGKRRPGRAVPRQPELGSVWRVSALQGTEQSRDFGVARQSAAKRSCAAYRVAMLTQAKSGNVMLGCPAHGKESF